MTPPAASPDYAAFAEGFAAGQGQVLWRERVADLDTPVGAFLKLAAGPAQQPSCWKAWRAARRAGATPPSASTRT